MSQDQMVKAFIELITKNDKKITDKIMQEAIGDFFKGTIDVGGKELTVLDEECGDFEILDLRIKRFLENRSAMASDKKNVDRHFIVSHLKGVKEVGKMLSCAKLSNVMYLISFLQLKSDNLLVLNNEPLNHKTLAKEMGNSERTAKRIIDELKAMKFLYEEEGKLFVNKKFHEMGQVTKSKNWIKLFKTKIQELHKKCGGGPELGLLYKILPYVHWKTSTLCKYPNEEDLEKIEPFNAEGLAKELDLEPHTISRYMNKLSDYGVVMITGAHKNVLYKIHPDYAFRQRIYHADALKDFFKEHQAFLKQQTEKRRNRPGKKKEKIMKKVNNVESIIEENQVVEQNDNLYDELLGE